MKRFLLIIFLFTLISFSYAAPPVFITITSPSDGSYICKSVTIEAQLNQTPKARSVKFYIDNNLVGEDTASPYQYTWDTTSYPDGQHTLYASILQAPERPTPFEQESLPALESPKITVTVDNSPPTQPQVTDDGAYTTSLNTLHASWLSEDPHSSIIEYQYSMGTEKGKTDILDWTSSNADTEITLDNLTLTQGKTYYFNVKAKNGVELWSQIGSSDGIIANDGTTLLLDIISPLDNSVINTSSITVTGTVSRNDAQVKVNGKLAQVANNTFFCQLNLIEGTHTITARAEVSSQVKIRTIQVKIDTTPPSINIYTPDKDSTTRSNIIYGRVSDDTQTVTVNGSAAELLSDFRFIGRPVLSEGANTITVQATDKAGNTSQKQISITYNTQTPKVTITSPLDNSTQNISPIKVEGTNTTDLSFILVNGLTAGVIPAGAGIPNFTAEGVTLDSAKTVITVTGFDANSNKFQDAIVVNSPDLTNYELNKVSGDVTEDDPDRPSAGSNQILKVRLDKNNQPTPNEKIQFSITQGNGTLSLPSADTDINGEAEVILTTDTKSDITNQVECFPTSNPQVKITFYVDTKPGQPSILTKITDETITPVPGATIPLIVKLTDSNNNPIPNENINFQIIQGQGLLSLPGSTGQSSNVQAATTYYGEAKVNLTCPNLGLTLTQIRASSSTVPSVTATFNITTSAPLAVTVDDIINKVNYNDSKIQDIKADITVTSNAEFLPSAMQLKIWQKGEKQKVQEISPNPGIQIRPSLETVETIQMDRQIISYDSNTNIYILKLKVATQTEEKPYELWYVDYNKGIILKEEDYYNEGYVETLFITEYSEFIQLPETDNAWVYNKKIEKIYEGQNNLTSVTTITITNRQVNTGIPDSEFQ